MKNKNQEEIEKIKALMKENERQIQEIQAQIEENEKERKRIKNELIKNKVSMGISIIWFYISTILKIPAYTLMTIYLCISLLWDKNLYALMVNIYHQRYTQDELDVIFGHFLKVSNHLAFIFYIVLFGLYTFFN